MELEELSIDTETFRRTTSRFTAKRQLMASGAIEMLAKDVVERLAKNPSHLKGASTIVVKDDSLAAFCNALLKPSPDAAIQFIQERRLEGETKQNIYLGYITAAARQLGDRWDTGELSFTDVTIGTTHLYSLMRALRADKSLLSSFASSPQKYAFFATVPGEDHGIGVTVAADLFRELGWEIDLRTGADHDALIDHIENTQPQVIGLSFSSEKRLNALVRLVVGIRLVIPNAIIGVAPTDSLTAEELIDLVDIDLVFDDAHSAISDIERLIELRY